MNIHWSCFGGENPGTSQFRFAEKPAGSLSRSIIPQKFPVASSQCLSSQKGWGKKVVNEVGEENDVVSGCVSQRIRMYAIYVYHCLSTPSTKTPVLLVYIYIHHTYMDPMGYRFLCLLMLMVKSRCKTTR